MHVCLNKFNYSLDCHVAGNTWSDIKVAYNSICYCVGSKLQTLTLHKKLSWAQMLKLTL